MFKPKAYAILLRVVAAAPIKKLTQSILSLFFADFIADIELQ